MSSFQVATLTITSKIGGNNFGISIPWSDEEGITDTYTNNYAPISATMQTHPVAYTWSGGSFSAIPFKLRIYAGDKNTVGVENPEALQTFVENLFKVTILPYNQTSPAGAASPLGSGIFNPQGRGAVTITMGSSWIRSGYIEKLSVKRGLPMDSNGFPYLVDISFSFILKFFPNMPSSSNFKFTTF